MALIQAAIFLLFGVGLLAVDYQSLSKGVLPCGPNGLKGRVEFSRTEHPAGYWLMFAVYGIGGIALVIFALRLLSGAATPLPLT